MQFRSGIEVKITDPNGIAKYEAYGLVILILVAFPQIVRILIAMGFDTWKGKLGNNPNTLDCRLEDFVNYQSVKNITCYDEPKYEKSKAIIQSPQYTSQSDAVKQSYTEDKNTEVNGNLYGKINRL